MPKGARNIAEKRSWVSAGMPSSSSFRSDRLLSSSRSTHFSPQMVATVDTRTSTLAAVELDGDLAVLGTAALDDVHAGHDLDPADHAGSHLGGQGHGVVQGAVDAVPDPDVSVLRLDVDVGGPVAQGLGHDQVARAGRPAPRRPRP